MLNTVEKILLIHVLKSNVRLGRTLYEAAIEQRPSSWPEVRISLQPSAIIVFQLKFALFKRWSGGGSREAEVMLTTTSVELPSCQKYSGPLIRLLHTQNILLLFSSQTYCLLAGDDVTIITNCIFSGIYKKGAKQRFHQRCKRRQKILMIVMIMMITTVMKMGRTTVIFDIFKDKL